MVSISGLKSGPSTRPCGPAMRASSAVSLPDPHATSSADPPACKAVSRAARRRHPPSVPSESTVFTRSYLCAMRSNIVRTAAGSRSLTKTTSRGRVDDQHREKVPAPQIQADPDRETEQPNTQLRHPEAQRRLRVVRQIHQGAGCVVADRHHVAEIALDVDLVLTRKRRRVYPADPLYLQVLRTFDGSKRDLVRARSDHVHLRDRHALGYRLRRAQADTR